MTLSTEQQFTLRQIEIEAKKMTHDQLMAIYMKRSREWITLQSISRQKRRLPNSPNDSVIADEALELELLRCHYKTATQVLDSLADEEMVSRLAVALQGACLALNIKQPNHGDAVAMVRAFCRMLTGDFPATNCRNIEAQLEGKSRGNSKLHN